jgi:hypothetical protein
MEGLRSFQGFSGGIARMENFLEFENDGHTLRNASSSRHNASIHPPVHFRLQNHAPSRSPTKALHNRSAGVDSWHRPSDVVLQFISIVSSNLSVLSLYLRLDLGRPP